MDKNPDWGPGRVDPFNPIKFRILKQPIDGTIGNADMMPLWNMKGRGAVHWDGVMTSFHESMLSSGIGNGASRKSISLESLGRLEQWFRDLPAPRYPLAIDAPLAARGAPLFTQHCASCHAAGGARTNAVIPIAEIGTDAHRLNMWTPESATAFNAFADGYAWDLTRVSQDRRLRRCAAGRRVAARPVSSQRVCGEPARLARAAREPPEGLLSRLRPLRSGARWIRVRWPRRRASGTRYDTGQPGNGNSGHLYGTTLTAPEKLALIEFLKTL